MDRPVIIRGNRMIFQDFKDSLSQRDETTGVYKIYTEYYSDIKTKFVEISLGGFDEVTSNYLKATYTRYNVDESVAESETFDLIYEGRALIDIDNGVINNDFYPMDRLESILNIMVNIAGMESIAQLQANRINTMESNINLIVNGNIEIQKQFTLSLDVFVNVEESRDITPNDFGKILTCNSEETITLTIPVEPEEGGFGNSACFFEFMKTGTGNVIIAGAEGVEFVQAVPDTLMQEETWTAIKIIRIAANTWLIQGALSQVV